MISSTYLQADTWIWRSTMLWIGLFFPGRSMVGSVWMQTIRWSQTVLASCSMSTWPAWKRSKAPKVMPFFTLARGCSPEGS